MLKTIENWEAEYMPHISKYWTLRECMEHVDHKWHGMRTHILRSYGMMRSGLSLISMRGSNYCAIRLGSSNCALCVGTCAHFIHSLTPRQSNCSYCPLRQCGGENSCGYEWAEYLGGNIHSMLRLIKKVKKIINDRDLTWDDMQKMAEGVNG